MTGQEKMIRRLRRPEGKIDVILDTDTYNEIDDQYALAYLIKSNEKLNIKGLYAAPFSNTKVATPKEGMELSYREILKILELMEEEKLISLIRKGSETYLADEHTPVISDAARDLADRAMEYDEKNPLYVVAIGAITNIASAILLKPEIKDRIVVVWLGGQSFEWHDNYEFNMFQDVAAARVVFDSQVPLVILPCQGVVSAFTTTQPELEYWLKDKNPLCNYLIESTVKQAEWEEEATCWSRPIWDVTAVGWLLDEKFMRDRLEPCPIPEYDHRYAFSKTRHLVKYVYHINRDLLFQDLFTKLAGEN